MDRWFVDSSLEEPDSNYRSRVTRPVLIAALSEESRMKVFAAFFDRKMSSSYRNGRKAGLVEPGAKRNAASVVSTERA